MKVGEIVLFNSVFWYAKLRTAGITDETLLWKGFSYELPKEYSGNIVKSVGIFITYWCAITTALYLCSFNFKTIKY